MTPDPRRGRQAVLADRERRGQGPNGPDGHGTVCLPGPAESRWDCSWFEPARTTGRPNLFESHRALTKTGAVRVRWDREQLIGGKPREARK